MRAATRVFGVAICLLMAHGVLAAPRPVDVFPDPLADYRRVEMVVTAGFKPRCAPQPGGRTVCVIPSIPADLKRLMHALRDGGLAQVDLQVRATGGAEIRFNIQRADVRFQTTMLQGPPRWVVELGTRWALGGPIQDELPFRPYPLPSRAFLPQIPPTVVEALPADGPSARAYNEAYHAWREGRNREALELSALIEPEKGGAVERALRLLVGEIWWGLQGTREAAEMDDVVNALAEAEDAAIAPLQAVRYALLAGQALEAMGYPQRAEVHRERRVRRYKGTTGEPYLLAGRVRGLIQVGDLVAARSMLETLRALPGDAPTVGTALLALAGLAYQERSYVVAVGLFDRLKARWPEVLTAHPDSLFQAAEVYRLYDRMDEARGLYEDFIARYPTATPHWVVRVRLAEMLAFRDPPRAELKFRELASTLRETEGQDLAFLRIAQLSTEVSERRRIVRNLARGSLGDYVRIELLVHATREAINRGRIRAAFEHARELWRVFPDAPILKRAPLLFERTLMLLASNYLKADRPLAVLSLYYAERKRMEQFTLRGAAHLFAGRALRQLAMGEEALQVLQRGLGGRTERDEPDSAAQLYLEMAGVLREMNDAFRLSQILAYLDVRHPRRFDNLEYWLARGKSADWSGETKLAHSIYLYALNGPVTPAQRTTLAEAIADLHMARHADDPAIKALRAVIAFHDADGRAHDVPRRRDALWRIAELQFDRAAWAKAAAALTDFVEAYPDDNTRFEARFLAGQALLNLGDERGAMRQWDTVARGDRNGVYGKMSARELKMLTWRNNTAPRVMDRAGL